MEAAMQLTSNSYLHITSQNLALWSHIKHSYKGEQGMEPLF